MDQTQKFAMCKTEQIIHMKLGIFFSPINVLIVSLKYSKRILLVHLVTLMVTVQTTAPRLRDIKIKKRYTKTKPNKKISS